MHHVEFSPLLQALLVVLLVATALQIVRVTRWRGRIALFAFVLVCVVTNPGRARHVRAMQRATPDAEVRIIQELIEYHDFVVFSATSIKGQLVSLGMIDRILVGTTSCTTLSTISSKSFLLTSKGICKP